MAQQPRMVTMAHIKRLLVCRRFHRWQPAALGGWTRTVCWACEDTDYGESALLKVGASIADQHPPCNTWSPLLWMGTMTMVTVSDNGRDCLTTHHP